MRVAQQVRQRLVWADEPLLGVDAPRHVIDGKRVAAM
jgi:hypothetical protein